MSDLGHILKLATIRARETLARTDAAYHRLVPQQNKFRFQGSADADVRKREADLARQYASEQQAPDDDDLITDHRNIRGE